MKEYIYTFSEVEMTTDNLPGELDPRTFATRHNRWYRISAILQKMLSLIIAPCKPGTDLVHYREKIKAFYYKIDK